MKIWRYSGILFIATGLLHTIVAILLGAGTYMQMIKQGLFDSVNDDFEKGFAFWFLICGLLIMMLGFLAHAFIKQTGKPLPVLLGYILLAVTILGCIVEPVSGFWLFLPQALIIILAKDKG
ncbi:hypothetical protein GGR21_003137 [Dysgonomonas hofstadii]|uniref:DUF4064 domain-containing protein n=1 Tax=Dysgonomonas hofstadii TaxID=637886 RepID=A0A840CMK7_9BACT|nr:DUF6463 family protein [Dysgonomonas hofstadii]MBB4037220.1 hypothetical protein [Dysgonomonas hofstadii]